MIVAKILLGLLGLGFVIFIHELGHFLGAKLTGITVETFSVGWGKKLASFTRNGTEYCLSLLPIGGYCKMKGDDAFKQAIDQNLATIPYEKGSFYSASPLRRIVTAMMGPAFSLLLPVLILTAVWFFGFTVQTQSNRIILANDYHFTEEALPPQAAMKAGLRTGDRIVAINGLATENANDVQENIASYPGEQRLLTVERDGSRLSIPVTPELDTKTGVGRIGVYFWVDPVIATVDRDSAAYIAGLKPGDIIRAVNGTDVRNSIDLAQALAEKPQKALVTVERDGTADEYSLVLTWAADGTSNLGIAFKALDYHTPRYTLGGAVVKGWNEMVKTLVLSVKSIGLLFRGVDASQAVSGPVRTTVIVGEVAMQGFSGGFGHGLSVAFNFISILSIAIFITQMIPIPALDGGQTLLFLIEMVSGKRLKTKFVYWFQTVGTILIFALMIFALFGDVVYLFRQ